jgi:hypothetical protein
MVNTVLTRLREPSSFAGIAVLLSLFGVNLGAEWGAVIAQVAGAISAVLAVVMREKAR